MSRMWWPYLEIVVLPAGPIASMRLRATGCAESERRGARRAIQAFGQDIMQ
jgi:hypothetical protein